MGMVLIRIGSPGELDVGRSSGNETGLKRGPRFVSESTRSDPTIYEGNRDREHRKRARRTLARRIRDQQQYEGVLVSGQREACTRIPSRRRRGIHASQPIFQLARESGRVGREVDESRSVRR